VVMRDVHQDELRAGSRLSQPGHSFCRRRQGNDFVDAGVNRVERCASDGIQVRVARSATSRRNPRRDHRKPCARRTIGETVLEEGEGDYGDFAGW